jgi:hypothetical protein
MYLGVQNCLLKERHISIRFGRPEKGDEVIIYADEITGVRTCKHTFNAILYEVIIDCTSGWEIIFFKTQDEALAFAKEVIEWLRKCQGESNAR